MTTTLDHWRDHPERWAELACAAVRGEDGVPDDARRAAREAVLRLLLRDRRDSDAGDFWQLSEAKYTSFDTSCGLDAFLLFPAGVAATLEHVERSDHPDRDEVAADLREHLAHDPGLEHDRTARLAGMRRYHSG